MTFKSAIAAIALVASAGFATADQSQLAKTAGVDAGVYSTSTLVGLIHAAESDDYAQYNFLLTQTLDNTRLSSRGADVVDYDALIAEAVSSDDFARASALESAKESGTKIGRTAVSQSDIIELIAAAEQDDEHALASTLRSRLN
ncbi:MAG: hypothetical protein AAGD04_00975 [Pseudomonadota bacterium]